MYVYTTVYENPPVQLAQARPNIQCTYHCISVFTRSLFICQHSQACFEENPMALLAPDSQGNTIAHLVAASGNTEVFEV